MANIVIKTKPKEITQNFIKDINTRKKRIVNFLGCAIIINPKVFPVDSKFSYSSKITAKRIPENPGFVLDLGAGTGVQAIIAAKRGAKKVLALDIDDNCLDNVRENVNYNKLEKIIEVRKSNLFKAVKSYEKFDLIISQLPFADVDYDCNIKHFLFDPKYKLHNLFLKDAKQHLKKNGKIFLPSGSVANEKKLLYLINKYKYKINSVIEEKSLNAIWKLYILNT